MKKTILLALLALLPGACVASEALDCEMETINRKVANFEERLDFFLTEVALALKNASREDLEEKSDELIALGRSSLLQMAKDGKSEFAFHSLNGFVYKIFFCLTKGGELFVSRILSYNCFGESVYEAHKAAFAAITTKIHAIRVTADKTWFNGRATRMFKATGDYTREVELMMDAAEQKMVENLYSRGLRGRFRSDLVVFPEQLCFVRITNDMKLEVGGDAVFADLTGKNNPLADIMRARVAAALAAAEAACPICACNLSEARELACWPCRCGAVFCKACLEKLALEESCSVCRLKLTEAAPRWAIKREDKASEAAAAVSSGGASGSATE